MKSDLQRLYTVERLSAAKIAKVYGLKYKNDKVAESTVLYRLKKNGIQRRDRAEHIKKVTIAMVDEWLKRYQTGESLKEIAAGNVDPVTVWNHLRARGLVLRDKVQAQIQAVTKYERKPFSGDRVERAYLMGIRYGDFHVVRHGRAIRVRVSTTHPALADLFESLFASYAHVARYPRKAKLTDFEWTLECDLDSSFDFLLSKPVITQLEELSRAEMIAFLAGLFDAEGSIFLHDKQGRYNPEAAFTNTEGELMTYITKCVGLLGFHCKLSWVIQNLDRKGITGYSRKGQVILWRFRDVLGFLQLVPIKHAEKIAKSRLVQQLEFRGPQSRNLQVARNWEILTSQIKRDRLEFAERAREELENRGRKPDKRLSSSQKGKK